MLENWILNKTSFWSISCVQPNEFNSFANKLKTANDAKSQFEDDDDVGISFIGQNANQSIRRKIIEN